MNKIPINLLNTRINSCLAKLKPIKAKLNRLQKTGNKDQFTLVEKRYDDLIDKILFLKLVKSYVNKEV